MILECGMLCENFLELLNRMLNLLTDGVIIRIYQNGNMLLAAVECIFVYFSSSNQQYSSFVFFFNQKSTTSNFTDNIKLILNPFNIPIALAQAIIQSFYFWMYARVCLCESYESESRRLHLQVFSSQLYQLSVNNFPVIRLTVSNGIFHRNGRVLSEN